MAETLASLTPDVARLTPSSTPDTVSHWQRRTPSIMCRSQPRFLAWQIALEIETKSTTDRLVPNLEQFPAAAVQVIKQNLELSHDPWTKSFYTFLSERTSRLEKTCDDPFNLAADLPFLAFSYAKFRHAQHKKEGDLSLRQGIDDLFLKVFALTPDSSLSTESEAHIQLPSRPHPEIPMILGGIRSLTPNPEAIADRIVDVVVPLPELAVKAFNDFPDKFTLREMLTWRASSKVGDQVTATTVTLPLAIAEMKSGDETTAKNQLVMDFASARAALRVLGLDHLTLYGFIFNAGTIRVFTSKLENGEHVVTGHADGVFVDRPDDFICFYLYLIQLRK